MNSEEYKSIVFKKIPRGLATVCTLDEENPHMLYLDKCDGFKKGDEIFVFCEKHGDYVKLEKAEEEMEQKAYTQMLCKKTGEDEAQYLVSESEDGITLRCGGCGKTHSYEIGRFAHLYT